MRYSDPAEGVVSMKLWKIWQEDTDEYDTYSSAIVVSDNPVAAKRIHPYRCSHSGEKILYYDEEDELWRWCGDNEYYGNDTWADPKNDIKAVFVGYASSDLKEGDVVCASFHAG